METTDKSEIIEKNYEASFELLKSKGLTLNEILSVRNSFVNWEKQFDENVEYNTRHRHYKAKDFHVSYIFKTEKEAKFINALTQLSPSADRQKILQVFGIVLKLLDIHSDYAFDRDH